MEKSMYHKSQCLSVWLEFLEIVQQPFLYVKKPRSLTREKHIRYGSLRKNRFNMIYDGKATEKRPLLIYVHGGGFVSGDLDSRDCYCYDWAKSGYVVANIDYSNAPKAVFPTIYREIFAALDIVLDNAEKYNIDTSKIIVNGESAGGHIALYIANFAKDKSLFDKLNVPFKHKDIFDIKGVVSNCGAIGIASMATSTFLNIKPMVAGYSGFSIDHLINNKDSEEVSILTPAVTNNYPPTYIIYAEHDALKLESFALQEKLMQKNIPHEVFPYVGKLANHAYSLVPMLKQSGVCKMQTIAYMNKAVNNDLI